jgi:uncharacterized delta-60 repeat protein
MKKKLLFLLMSLYTVHATAQGGSLDPNFATAGRLTHFSGSNPVKFLLQSNEKIVAIGHRVNLPTIDYFAARFKQNGLIDSTFGTYGIATASPAGASAVTITCGAVQADDKIIIAGIISGADYQLTLARLKANGNIDSTFNGIGRVNIDLPDSFVSVYAVKVMYDGKIVIAGGSGNLVNGGLFPTLVRLKPDGLPDNSFGINGISRITDVGFSAYFNDMALQPDGKIVATLNQTSAATPSQFYVMRLDLQGARDNTFGTNGLTSTPYTNSAAATSVMVQADNKIVVAGLETFLPGQLRLGLNRYTATGALDNAFGSNGKTIYGPTYSLGAGSAVIAQQPDGKVVVSASSKADASSKFDIMLSRFRTNGIADGEFGNGGYVLTDYYQNSDNSTSIAILNNGMILAGGYSTVTQPYQAGTIAGRYNYCGISVTGQPENLVKKAGSNAQFSLVASLASATYQWQKQGTTTWENLTDAGQYSGTQTFNLTVSNVTMDNTFSKYRCAVTSGTCSDTSDIVNLTVEAVDNIDEVLAASGISIYPNPSNGQLFIDLKDTKLYGLNYFITDLPGKKISSGTLQAKTTTLHIEGLSQGIYLLHLEHLGTLKFIRN